MFFASGRKPRTFFFRTPVIARRGATIVCRGVVIDCRGAEAGRRAVTAAAAAAFLQSSSSFEVLEVGGGGGVEAESRDGAFERRRLYFVDTSQLQLKSGPLSGVRRGFHLARSTRRTMPFLAIKRQL